MKYIYFVSYAHDRGFGNTELTTNHKISTMEEIKNVKKLVEDKGEVKGIAILNFILLKKEN
jgi:hypothetical protein